MVKLRCKVVLCGDATTGKTSIIKMLVERNFPNQYIITSYPQVFRKEILLPSTNSSFTAPPSDTPVIPREVIPDDEYHQDELSTLQQQMLGHVEMPVESGHRHHQMPMDEIELYLFDIGGSKLYEDTVDGLLEDCNAFVIVYDVTKESSFLNAQKWYEKCAKSRPSSTDKKKHSPTLIGVLIGNKSDQTAFQKVSPIQGEGFAKSHNLSFYKMSAMADSNMVEEPFQYIAQQFQNFYNERTEVVGYLLEHGH